MSAYEHWSLVWLAITAIATVCMALVVCIAAILTLSQVREATKARQLEATMAILKNINIPTLYNARRLIYDRHHDISDKVNSDPSWEEFDSYLIKISRGKVDLESFHAYLASLESMSVMVLHDLAPDNIIEMYYARLVPSHWLHLEHYIRYVRRKYGTDSYLQHFEMLTGLLIAGSLSKRKKVQILEKRKEARKQSEPT